MSSWCSIPRDFHSIFSKCLKFKVVNKSTMRNFWINNCFGPKTWNNTVCNVRCVVFPFPGQNCVMKYCPFKYIFIFFSTFSGWGTTIKGFEYKIFSYLEIKLNKTDLNVIIVFRYLSSITNELILIWINIKHEGSVCKLLCLKV